MTHSQINLTKVRGFLLLMFVLILISGCNSEGELQDCILDKDDLVEWGENTAFIRTVDNITYHFEIKINYIEMKPNSSQDYNKRYGCRCNQVNHCFAVWYNQTNSIW